MDPRRLAFGSWKARPLSINAAEFAAVRATSPGFFGCGDLGKQTTGVRLVSIPIERARERPAPAPFASLL